MEEQRRGHTQQREWVQEAIRRIVLRDYQEKFMLQVWGKWGKYQLEYKIWQVPVIEDTSDDEDSRAPHLKGSTVEKVH